MVEEKNKSTSGVPQGIAGVICYFIPLVGGLIFLFLEKENKLVRFHAVQSILLWIVFILVLAIFSWIPIIGWLIDIAVVVLWLFTMYQALMEREFMLPAIGGIAKRQVYGKDDSEA